MQTTHLLLFLLVLSACASQQTALPSAPAQNSAQMMHPAEQPPGMMNGTNSMMNNVKEFSVEAFQFGYEPAELHVKKGDRVIIHLSTRDVGHSLSIKEYHLNIPATAGNPGTGDFIADQEGSFNWRCRMPCGAGHETMHGTLIVEP